MSNVDLAAPMRKVCGSWEMCRGAPEDGATGSWCQGASRSSRGTGIGRRRRCLMLMLDAQLYGLARCGVGGGEKDRERGGV